MERFIQRFIVTNDYNNCNNNYNNYNYYNNYNNNYDDVSLENLVSDQLIIP